MRERPLTEQLLKTQSSTYETMMADNKIITAQDLEGWPSHWLPPCKFLGPLVYQITSVIFLTTLTEHQVTLRFKNRYGVRISENFFHKGLYLVDVLKFRGLKDDQYDLVYDAPVPDSIWYFNSHEVFALSEKVAQWERRSNPSKEVPPPNLPSSSPAGHR